MRLGTGYGGTCRPMNDRRSTFSTTGDAQSMRPRDERSDSAAWAIEGANSQSSGRMTCARGQPHEHNGGAPLHHLAEEKIDRCSRCKPGRKVLIVRSAANIGGARTTASCL